MLALEIELHDDAKDPRLDEVKTQLRAHNWGANPAFMLEATAAPPTPLIALALMPDGQVAGGLIGDTRGRWFKVNMMAVRADLRRQRIGARLLAAAEQQAFARGCDRVFLETMEYQAPAFYEACGYSRRCELGDWDSHGHCKFIYVKEPIRRSEG